MSSKRGSIHNTTQASAQHSRPRVTRGWRRWASSLLRVGISAAILFWIFYSIFGKEEISPQQFRGRLLSIEPFWLVAAIAMVGVSFGLAVVRWHAILRVQNLNLGWARTVGIFFIGAFFNTFMVGVTGGDIMKAYYVARETHHKQTEAVMTVVVDRLIGFLGLFVFSIALLTANLHFVLWEGPPHFRVAALSVLAMMFLALAVMALGFCRSLRKWFDKFPATVRALLDRAADAYQIYAHHPAVVVRAFVWSIGVHAATTLATVALARGLHLSAVSVGRFFVVLPVINCLTALPIGFSGLGVREGLYLTFFGPMGMQQSDAVSLSLLFFAATLFWNLIGGWVFMFWRKTNPPPPSLP